MTAGKASRFRKGTCERCGKLITERTDGSGLRAHDCPHGKACQIPAWKSSAMREAAAARLGCAECEQRAKP